METLLQRRPWLMPIVLAVLTLIFMRPLALPARGQGIDSPDMVHMNYPLQQLMYDTLRSGELPLWNPHEFIGHPIAGNPQSALFYPVTWFVWLVGVVRGLNISFVLHTWWGAWGMAVLMRRFKASYVGSLLAGIIFTMSGLAAARLYAGHYTQFSTFAWLPWMMAAFEYALARGTWLATLPGMAATGLAALAGHPQMLVYGGVCLVALWIYHVLMADDLLTMLWKASRVILSMVIGGAILGAALIVPTLELSNLSQRSDTDISFANSYVLPPAQMITLVVPGFFGNPITPPNYYWGANYYEEYNAYAGLLPLIAIPLAFRWRRRENGFFLALIAFGIVGSLGLEGALMPIIWRWLPILQSFRGPSHALLFVVIGMAGLTAFLVTALQNSTPEERETALRPAVKFWVPALSAACFFGAVYFSGWYASASHVEPMPTRALVISSALAESGAIALAVWLALWLWTERDIKALRWALLVTCLVVTLDAWHMMPTLVNVTTLVEDPIWAGARAHIPTGPDARVVGPLGFENVANQTGHLNVSAYDPLGIERYVKLQALSDKGDPTTPVNTLLGVKYFMTTKPFDKPNFKLLGIEQAGIYYERTDPFPRAWVAKNIVVEANDDAVRASIAAGKENLAETVYVDRAVDCPASGGTATITDYRANSVTITTGGGGGLLTLSDQYYPGWEASVDGKTAPIVRADTVFRGVCVPAGDHTVRFEYRPRSVMLGAGLSVAGWAVLGVLMLFSLLRRRPASAA